MTLVAIAALGFVVPGGAVGQLTDSAKREVASSTSIVGQWKGETFAAGGLASVTLGLFANGTYARKIIVTNEYGWTREGDVLLMAPVVSVADSGISYGKAAAVQLKVLDDSTMMASAGTQSLRLRRITTMVTESPLLGRWEGLSDLNEAVTQDFTADGRLIVGVTVSREAGRYTTAGESITWATQIPVPGRRVTRYRLESGKLLIYTNPQLPPLEMVRAEGET
jgi:hypothetical protein